jgi:hypothetical protein
MSVAAFSSTTLSAAITKSQTKFAVASTSGVYGIGSLTNPQTTLVVDGEAMLVQSVPVSGVVEVMRGAHGTKAKAHVSGSVAYVASPSRLSGVTADGQHVTFTGSDDGPLPGYAFPLGYRQVVGGKEYVLCDFQETVHSGVTVSISNDGLFTASVLTTSHQGAVGVVAETTTASDTWGWVQVYGYTSAQEAGGTSAATSAYVPIVASSVSSPAAGMAALVNTTSTAQRHIYGMFIVGAATTAVTSAASHTGVAVPVFLDYPYVFAAVTDPGLS